MFFFLRVETLVCFSIVSPPSLRSGLFFFGGETKQWFTTPAFINHCIATEPRPISHDSFRTHVTEGMGPKTRVFGDVFRWSHRKFLASQQHSRVRIPPSPSGSSPGRTRTIYSVYPRPGLFLVGAQCSLRRQFRFCFGPPPSIVPLAHQCEVPHLFPPSPFSLSLSSSALSFFRGNFFVIFHLCFLAPSPIWREAIRSLSSSLGTLWGLLPSASHEEEEEK